MKKKMKEMMGGVGGPKEADSSKVIDEGETKGTGRVRRGLLNDALPGSTTPSFLRSRNIMSSLRDCLRL